MFFLTRPTGGVYLGKALFKAPRVNELNVSAPARIVFASDMHLRKKGAEHADMLAALIKELAPELLLLGGDISEYDEGERRFLELLRDINPVYGKFAVAGNNEDGRFGGDDDELKRLFTENGVTLLSNELAAVNADGRRIEIVGVEDIYSHSPCAEGLFTNDESAYRILLSHAPHSFLLKQASPAPHLMLSGHTHGGQINMLGLTCYELLRYEHWYSYTHLAGVKRIGDTVCVVSRGIGYSKYAIRAFSQPEIHLIT